MKKTNGFLIIGIVLLIIALLMMLEGSRRSSECDTIGGNLGMAFGVGECYGYRTSGFAETGAFVFIAGIVLIGIGLGKIYSSSTKKEEPIHSKISEAESTKKHKFCKECGTKISKSSKFCEGCGAKQ